MPLIKECKEQYQQIAIWHIEEQESFFREEVRLDCNIKNEKRRLEFFVGRYLLKYIVPNFPLAHIAPDNSDKPRLPDNEYFFSISHSYPYAAVVVSKTKECGIDLQTWRPNMKQLQNKFLSKKEQAFFSNDEHLLTLAWCAKEAAYKWNGKRGIDFIQYLPIVCFDSESCSVEIRMSNEQTILLKGGLEKEFAWCVVTETHSV
jgi:phosphopantetheinyl transferase